MKMIPVSSSAISAVGYDETTMQLYIKFSQWHTYTFCRVPKRIFDGLLAASSKGSRIKGARLALLVHLVIRQDFYRAARMEPSISRLAKTRFSRRRNRGTIDATRVIPDFGLPEFCL